MGRLLILVLGMTIAAPLARGAQIGAPSARQSASHELSRLIDRALSIQVPHLSEEEFAQAAREYRAVLEALRGVDRASLALDDQVDYDLVESKVKTHLFEIEDIKLQRVVPIRYFALGRTDDLFVRPGALPDSAVQEAVEELERLPEVLENAKKNLRVPARVWTENAIYQAYYAKILLRDEVPQAAVDAPSLKQALVGAAAPALRAVEDYETWLENVLLPRSNRSAAWKPEEIEFYQFVHEHLDEYGVDEMIRIAQEEETRTAAEMESLARRIHPSGDLQKVWELMKEEAPPWDGVLPMAERYVNMMTAWLKGPGSHVVTIPGYIDYGARLSPPMARRTLSFGGATQGPTLAGRQSGYYVLTPLEDRLSPEESASRIQAYNPYWTHVISYHEWLGHNVQIAAARANVDRPIRRRYESIYLSQAWSFYLEKLMEDEGYYQTLPYMEQLKTMMARLQMRMWRIQRILTKCKMAKGEMTFEEAVRAYIDKIGMEPANSFIEVQRDSQSPSPPGREIIGERVILELREEYRRRMGEHYRLKNFNDNLLTYGEIPLKQIRRLMFH